MLLWCCLVFAGGRLHAQACVNADFSSGNFNGWTGTYSMGQCDGYNNGRCTCSPTNPYNAQGFNQGPNDDPVNDAANEYNQIITTTAGGYDVNLANLGYNLPTVYPGNTYSARIGNMWQELSNTKTGDGESISYTFRVSADNSNFTYHYAVVLYNGNHSPGEQSYFNISMVANGSDTIACGEYEVDATTAETIGGFTEVDSVYWKPWSSVVVPLADYIGQTVTITFTTRGCIPNGCAGKHYAYAYIAAECSSLGLLASKPSTCGENDTLTAPEGCATYSWSGPGIVAGGASQQAIINQAGTYTVSMTTFGNTPCTFAMDTVITGTNPVAAFAVDSSVCTGDPVTFNNLSTSSGGISSWQWNFGDGDSSGEQSPTHTFTGAGIYPVTLAITAGSCTRDTTILVTVVAPPTADFTVESPVCIYTNSNIVYTGNAPPNATFNWNFDGGTGNPLTGPGPLNISWLTSGTKDVILSVVSGSCTSTPDTVQVMVKPYLGMQLTPYTSICQGGSATLTANNCTTYNWAANPTLNDTNTATVIATPTVTTTYSVTGSDAHCVSVDTVTVAVYNYPSPAFTATGPVCIGQNSTVTYTGNTGATTAYNWNFDGGAIASGTGSGPYEVNWLAPGTYDITLTVSLAICDTSSTDTISVFSQPQHPALSADTLPGCPGLPVCFTSSPVGNNIGYTWTFGDGLSSDSENACHVYSSAGVYSVSFHVALSPECVFDTTLPNLITIDAGAVAAFEPSATLIQQPESLITFTNQSRNATHYLWNFTVADSSQSIGNSTSTDDTFNFTNYGQYDVTLYAYNQLGCPDSTTKVITVLPGQNYFIPNAFTPNNDGLNDNFYVQMQPGVTVLSFQVFDRWGELVHDGAYPWDGTYKGQPAPQGVYVYLAFLHLVDYDTNVKCQGSVTLLR